MILYHGTSTEYRKKILSEGILPRGITDNQGTWPEVPSKFDLVYLTTAYPVYYAVPTVKKGKNLLIVKVDVLKESLYPDEDYIAHLIKQTKKQISLKVISLSINPKKFKEYAESSLRFMGNVCLEKVEKEQIIDTKIIKVKDVNTILSMGGDAIPSPINYKICGHYYRQCMRYIFGETKTKPVMWETQLL